jgi:two-component system nitrate/nitrite response regulator NarL
MQENSSAPAEGFPTVLVEPGHLLREGLSMILDTARFNVLASTPCVDEACLSDLPGAGLSLLVIGAGPDFGRLAEDIRTFKTRQPEGLVAVLIDDDDTPANSIAALFAAGANTCLSKHATGEVLVRSLELLTLGQRVLPARVLRALVDGPKAAPRPAMSPRPQLESRQNDAEEDVAPPPLSAQEKRILLCLVEGHSNKSIARKFEIAEATVKVHLKAILRKIRLQNRTQAAIWALNHVESLTDVKAKPPRHAARSPIAA